MNNILILLGIFGWLSVFAESTEVKKIRWVLASDFNATELVGLSPEQEHELHLKSLSKKDSETLGISLSLALVTKSIGSDAFGFPADENTNREHNAIARATFDSFTKLHLQDRILNVLRKAIDSAAASMKEPDSTFSSAFSLACSKIDDGLKNESIYTTFRDEYKKESQTSSKKPYFYGIAKSEEELRKAFVELMNDPLMKKLDVHFAYALWFRPEGIIIRKSILELVSTTGKLESVQKIYDQSVEETVSLLKDLKPEEIDLNNVYMNPNIQKLDVRTLLSEKLQSKIKENSELISIFGPIHERIQEEIAPAPKLFIPRN